MSARETHHRRAFESSVLNKSRRLFYPSCRRTRGAGLFFSMDGRCAVRELRPSDRVNIRIYTPSVFAHANDGASCMRGPASCVRVCARARVRVVCTRIACQLFSLGNSCFVSGTIITRTKFRQYSNIALITPSCFRHSVCVYMPSSFYRLSISSLNKNKSNKCQR